MDPKDTEILGLVQGNARLTADAIGATVGLSPAAVQKRLKRLRDSGVIEKEIAVLSPKAMGRELTFIVEVALLRENTATLDAFKRDMRAAGCVQQCYYTTGEADFILVLMVQDMKEYEQFTKDHFLGAPNVGHFKTAVVMDRVKVSLDVI